jgi:hypothetical protein
MQTIVKSNYLLWERLFGNIFYKLLILYFYIIFEIKPKIYFYFFLVKATEINLKDLKGLLVSLKLSITPDEINLITNSFNQQLISF